MAKKETKHIATLSLGVMAAGFAATIPLQDAAWGRLLQSGFEAGLVGGLADWFAVTALFRHPLNIPIPHTRLLPKNRDKLTDALVSALETHLLNKTSIEDKIRQLQLTSRLLDTAETELQKDSVKAGIRSFLKHTVDSISADACAGWLQKELAALIRSVELSGTVDWMARELVNRRVEESVLDFAADKAAQWVLREQVRLSLGRMAIQAIERLELSGMMAFAVNAFVGFMNEEKLGGILQNLILSTLNDLRTPGHPGRTHMLDAIRTELAALGSNPNVNSHLEQWREKLIESFITEEKLARVLNVIKELLMEWIEQPEFADTIIVPFLSGLIEKARNNPERLQAADQWLVAKIMGFMERNYSKIGDLARENISKLDDEALIELIEDKAGKDLQWIRVNGAICGFLIGLVLYGVKALF
ncbi:DUF445 domain-containing protein [Paenibacillus sp. y28]|uniref:DUF445 domain-containing protein n=1 Tax=Paenibacillus sp. y28 TaxID=3129110 RepID=UPI003018A536